MNAIVSDRTDWSQLDAAGFVVVRNYLSPAECEVLHEGYASLGAQQAQNGNYNVIQVPPPLIMRFDGKLARTCHDVAAASRIRANLTTNALFFGLDRGVSFAWHQDHESFFMFQDHSHYLNFYIPIVKPERARSNLGLIRFDRLLQRAPVEGARFVGKGATTFEPSGPVTRVIDDVTDAETTLPFNLEELAEFPELGAGDLLLMRGDTIHRTQDVSTARIAVSFRRQRAESVVRRQTLLAGGIRKRNMLARNPREYETLARYFEEDMRDELTVGYVLRRMIIDAGLGRRQ